MKIPAAVFLIMLSLPLYSQQQSYTVFGKVIDGTTSEPLPSASIRLIGTARGTISNAAGEFRFSVPEASASYVVSYLGYTSDTLHANLLEQTHYIIKLQPNTIQLAAVIVSGEDPAYEIIRRAIESKERWMSRLKTFEGRAFNRTQVRNDTSIAAITESYSTLYWNRDDSLREVITQQRQTGNMPKNVQPSRVGTIMNFNDNEIKQGGYTFIGPTAPNAFDYYDYRLIRTRTMDHFDIYDIELIPRSKISALFKGQISISERSYAVMEVDLRPNEAFVQPFITFKGLHYRQTFQLYEDQFWLPANYKFSTTIVLNIMGFSIPAIGLERDVVIYNYVINPTFADTVLALHSFTVDSSTTKFDSTFWVQHDVLPLTVEQDSAYKTLDSTQSLEKKFAPQGAGATFLNFTGNTLGFANIWFNRVEGLHLGISKSFNNLIDSIGIRGMIGYGFSDKEWKYSAGATLRFGPKRSTSGTMSFASIALVNREFSLDVDGYRKHVQLPQMMYEDHLGNSLASLLDRNDAFDYYRAEGGEVGLTYVPIATVKLNASALVEKQSSLIQHTDYSIFSRDLVYRPNPAIVDGQMNSLGLSASFSSGGLSMLSKNSFSGKIMSEYSTSALGSDFDFVQTSMRVKGKITTMEGLLLFPPALTVSINGGLTSGHLPPQRYYSFFTNLIGIVSGAGLRGVHAREFYGDSYIAGTVEHNFRRVLFAPLGIQWLMESNLELILNASAARAWLSQNVLRSASFPAKESNGYYYEAGLGISNILDFFRADITWRLSQPKEIVFTLGISDFLMGLTGE